MEGLRSDTHLNTIMRVHKCARCDGSGYVTGRRGWEIPWTQWAADAANPNNYVQVLQPRVCDDCGGTGALLELEPQPAPVNRLPYRVFEGLDYQSHVAYLLRRN